MVDDFYSIYGNNFYSMIQQWHQFGVFTVLLPLILIFAIVFAILEKINIFKNKGVHLIIALAIGFFTVSNPYISAAFLPLFSNLALGVAIMLILIILLGVAVKFDDNKNFVWIFGLPGIVLFIVVLARTGMLRYIFGENFDLWIAQNSSWVVLLIFLLLVVIAVIIGSKPEGERGLSKLLGINKS